MQNTNSHLIKKHGTTLYVKSLIIACIFVALIIIEAVRNGSYLDEIIGVASMFYIFFSRKKISRNDLITIALLFVVVVIGLASNIFSGINKSYISIVIDVVAETKLLFAFFATKYFLTEREKQSVIDMLVPFSKLYILSSFFCSILSLFVDIGMSGEERYGIPSFKFFFDFNFQYVAVYMLVFGIMVCNTKMSERKKKRYYWLAIISLVLATKAPPIMFSIIFVVLYRYFQKHQKLSMKVVIPLLIVVVIAGWFQIETYLLNESSPRRLFFEYAFKTANNYFPFGSGFATYGSDQAARVYSPLYYKYGFDMYNGMNPEDSAFLSDTFWPMAIGQFGWIGSIIYIAVYVRVFLTFSNKRLIYSRKAFLYSAFLQYMIHAIGAAILSSSAGLIGFMAISLFTIEEPDDQQANLPRVKLKI